MLACSPARLIRSGRNPSIFELFLCHQLCHAYPPEPPVRITPAQPREEKDQEERQKVEDLRGSPLSVGTLEEMIDDNHAIVSSSVGPEYYVNVLSFVNQDLLEPGSSVLLHNKVHFSEMLDEFLLHSAWVGVNANECSRGACIICLARACKPLPFFFAWSKILPLLN